MRMALTRRSLLTLSAFGLAGPPLGLAEAATSEPLASWNDGPAKRAIIGFVRRVTRRGGPAYLPPAERIATFDNDGTLWAEQPVYFQFQFALDRVKAIAPRHPEWKTTQPFATVIAGDVKALAASGEKGILQIIAATHAGMTSDEFAKTVAHWLAIARHPRFDRPYTDLAYRPMIELLAYLRGSGWSSTFYAR